MDNAPSDPRSKYSHPDSTGSNGEQNHQNHAHHGEDQYVGSGRLAGRKALITGADSGIGRAIAIAYAHEGADLAVTYLPSEQSDADQVIDYLRSLGGFVVALPGDLGDETFARQLAHDAHEALGGLDIVVNNAGKQSFNEDITTVSTDQIISTFTVNVFAMFWVIQEALTYLKPGASIINTSSIQATRPSPGLVDYAATKGAISNLTMGLAQQLTPKGIRVNAVAPGPIWTPIQSHYGKSPDEAPDFVEKTPLGRHGQPAELAGAYVFLASDDASYVSGEILGVTGGRPI